MDSSTSSAGTTSSSSRADSSARSSQRGSSSKSSGEKERTSRPEPKLTDYGVTVKGRFDADLRRFFVTILDTSSQMLIAQFPSQAVARYVQQLKKAAADGDFPPANADSKAARDPKLDQTT